VRLIAIPEPGQLVDVRQSRFVVTDIQQTIPLQSPVMSGLPKAQHLVTLASVEDDGLGDELQVIWELEAGAHVYEKSELPEPTGFDSPDRLDAFLDAVRWGRPHRRIFAMSSRPFAAALILRITSSTRWCGPFKCLG
jgi:hypothetical protein